MWMCELMELSKEDNNLGASYNSISWKIGLNFVLCFGFTFIMPVSAIILLLSAGATSDLVLVTGFIVLVIGLIFYIVLISLVRFIFNNYFPAKEIDVI